MKATLESGWEEIRTSFWFTPSIILLGAIMLSVVVLWVDQTYGSNIREDAWWVYGGGASGARAVLTTISGSMITVTSVVFSITIVTLTLASGQFGSRLLRNYMRDTGNQIVLGTFLATFVYSLLVLRSVRGSGNTEFVPYISVTVGVILVFISVVILIYYIHHVSRNIQAETIVDGVFKEVTGSVDKLFPSSIHDEHDDNEIYTKPDLPENLTEMAYPIKAGESNYLRAIEHEELMETATEHDLIIQLMYRPGDFIIQSGTMLLAWPSDRIDETLESKLSNMMVLGTHRTLTQDAEYGIHQMVEIAIRALSPGINDAFTAINCVDRLAAILCQVSQKRFPSPYHFDKKGRLRMITDTTTFEGYVDASFNQIRQNSGSNPAVLIRLMEAINRVAEQASTSEQYKVLRHHAEMIKNEGVRMFNEKRDTNDLLQRYDRAMFLIGDEG